jgi:RNA polymerase sigma-70 factor (ECF subfamily)
MPKTAQKEYHARKPDTSDIAALVEQARAGSRTALEQLVGMFQGDIFRMAYYRTHSSMDAEDLTQEIFMQAFKNLSRLKTAERFRSWLFKIALNRIRDFNRKKRFRALFSTLDDTDKVDRSYAETGDRPAEALDNLMVKDFWKQIRLFTDKLPRMEKEVFMLRFMDHLSIKEISQVLRKNESTVKTHLYRSIKKFKKGYSIRQLLQEGTA